jgi:hypothetical protein
MDRKSYTDLHLPESFRPTMGQNATRRIRRAAVEMLECSISCLREHASARIRGPALPPAA